MKALKLTKWMVIFATALTMATTGTGCGDDDGEVITDFEVSETLLIGVTPHPDFPTTGRIDFTLLPRNAAGQALLDTEQLALAVTASQPVSTKVTTETISARRRDRAQRVAAALNFDSSGSMENNDPDRLRVKAAQTFIDQLRGGDRVAVVEFNGCVKETEGPLSTTRILTDFTGDLGAAKAAAAKVEEKCTTPLYASVEETLGHFDSKYPAGSAHRGLLVLGDGRPNNDDGTLAAACAKAQSTGIPINTIGFGPAADQSPQKSDQAVQVLRELATCSGGAYTGIVPATDLEEAFRRFGLAATQGSVTITVVFDPIPAPDTVVEGQVSVGDGLQQPVTISYRFSAP